MIELVFPGGSLATLAATVRGDTQESFALLLARPVRLGRDHWRLLVNSIHLPGLDEYEARSAVTACPTASFRLPIEKRARLEGLSLIYCHSHPAQNSVLAFSAIDDETEIPLARYASGRVPQVPHASLVIGAEGYRARVLGTAEAVEVSEIGRVVTRHGTAAGTPISLVYDRQVRAFGDEGQRAVQGMRIAIIGLGGTGSVVAQQLAYLGVRRFLLIDPDVVDETSLNRLVGATQADLGRPKVLVGRRSIRRVTPGAQVRAIRGDILETKIGLLLTDVDFIFCCTDTHGSRYVVNQLAYQYFVPCIDMGVVINVHDGKVTHFDGRVQMLAPRLGCLVCRDGILSPDHIRWDLGGEAQRRADPYFNSQVGIKQPSVISLNSTAASLAVTMFLAAVAGVPSSARAQMIRGVQGVVRQLDTEPYATCINCSDEGFLGRGDTCPLPARAP
jgi:molybdopterin/thiamine biosynthesis adenylyltransferase